MPVSLPLAVPIPLSAVPHALRRLPTPVGAVAAGFPSPADDYVESGIDLNLVLIASPSSTFFMRVSGDAMRGDGICDDDLLVIDRSVTPRVGRLVVATHEGAFILRRLIRHGEGLALAASDGTSPPIPLALDPEVDSDGTAIWGVAIHAVHHLGPASTAAGVASWW